MSIIFDTLIGIVVLGAVVAGVGYLLFRDVFARIARYFRIWSEQDARRAEEAERDAAHRERAEAELDLDLNGPSDDRKIGL